MKMASKKGSRGRSSIDNVLDDLLGSDDEVSSKRKPSTASKPTPDPATKRGPQVKLSSNSSDAEFYKNLRKISGNDVLNKDEEQSEEEELSDDAARKLAENIGDLDDLDNNLFAGLGSAKKAKPEQKRVETKPPKRTIKKSSKIDSNYDLDDPLAGLGLSDDEELGGKASKAVPPRKPLARRLSSERRIEPNGTKSDNIRHDLDPNNDPFLSSDAKEGKITTNTKQNSFDDVTASESEISPRRLQQQQAPKNRRNKSHKKSSVEPTLPPKGSEVDGNNNKAPPPSKSNQVSRGRQKSTTDESDLFDDSDGLPGLSDEESATPKTTTPKTTTNPSKSANNTQQNQKKQQGRKSTTGSVSNIHFDDDDNDDDDIPNEKATSALDNLLGGGGASKKKQPTMLDQIMASKGKKTNNKITVNENKMNDDDDLLFGAYAPSVGGNNNNRPTTAPDRRSVHFADDLGLDLNDDSADGRPSTAPEKKKTSASADFLLDSSLDESTGKDFFSKVKQKKNSQQQNTETGGAEAKKETKKGKLAKQSSKDDWLGLGDDHTDQLDLLSSGELFSPRNRPPTTATQQAKKPATESPRTDDTNKSKKTDDLELPWESPSFKRRAGRRQATETTSQGQKNQDAPTESATTAHSENQLDGTASIQSPSKNEEDKIAEDNFLSLLKNKKRSTPIKKDTSGVVEASQSNVVPTQQQQQQQPLQQQHQQQHQLQQQLQQQQQQMLLSPSQPYAYIQTTQSQVPFLSPQPHHPQTFQQPSSEVMQQLRDELSKDLSMKHQDEFNASKRQFERDKVYLESELRELQEKVLKLNESRDTTTTDWSSKIRELETKISRLEMGRDNLVASIEHLKQRHKEEIAALETSHKNRQGYIEESYKRREQQLRDENLMMTSHFEEKEKAMKSEQDDLTSAHRKKCQLMEHNQTAEIERLKDLHKKSLEDLIKNHNEQIAHMRMVKEQEVNAAVSAFSHANSLQTLMQEVQHSTRELGNLQTKIDASHSTKLEERELSLKTRDQYLKNLENKLHAQETNNEEERQRLQNLVMKLEVQLREQTRQIDQDKWKMTQDDNRLKAMQSAFEEERRVTSEQLATERNQLAKAREEMLIEQRRIIAECYEEKRRITDEKNQFTMFQRDTIDQTRKDRSSAIQAESDLEATLNKYQHEASTIGVRIAQIKQKEEQLMSEKDQFVQQKTALDQEIERLRQATKEVQKRSEEIEKFAQEATQIQHDAEQAMEEAYVIKTEFMDANQELDAKTFSLQQQERSLNQEREKIREVQRELEADRRSSICSACKTLFNQHAVPLPAPSHPFNLHATRHPTTPQFNSILQQQQQQQQQIVSPFKNSNSHNPYNNSGVRVSGGGGGTSFPPSGVVSAMGGIDLRSSTPNVSSTTKQHHQQQQQHQPSSTFQNKPAIVPYFSQFDINNATPNIDNRNTALHPDVLNATYLLPDVNNNIINNTNNKETTITGLDTSIPKLEFQDFSVDSLLTYQAPVSLSVQNTKPTVFTESPSILKDFTYLSPVSKSQPPPVVLEPSTVSPPPPDLIMNNLEFKRTIRRWNTAKEMDDDFFEEEQRFLRSLQARRTR